MDSKDGVAAMRWGGSIRSTSYHSSARRQLFPQALQGGPLVARMPSSPLNSFVFDDYVAAAAIMPK
jgi:hypothetical protein